MNDPSDPLDELLVRRVAANHEIDPKTLMKGLHGERSRVKTVAPRQAAGVNEYRQIIAARKEAAEKEAAEKEAAEKEPA